MKTKTVSVPSEDEAVPMSPTMSKVIKMEEKRDAKIDALEAGEVDMGDERRTLEHIAKLQAQIDELMKLRLQRLEALQQQVVSKGIYGDDDPEEAVEEEEADEQEDTEEETEEQEKAGEESDDDPFGEGGVQPIGAKANGEVWVFASWCPEDESYVAAHAPEDWQVARSTDRTVTMVSGSVRCKTSKATGKRYPAKVMEIVCVEKLTARKAIARYEDLLDSGEFEEFFDAQNRNHVICILKKFEAA